jgi:DNA-binding transcriptional ArsR family regulator
MSNEYDANFEQMAEEQDRQDILLARLEIIDGPTMLTTHYEEPRYLWNEILPDAGLCVCAASKAAGKTLLLLQLADAIAKGKPFLGVPSTPAKVLFLELELSKRRTTQRLAKMGIVPVKNLSFAFHWEPGSAGLQDLADYIKVQGTRLVIVDVLQMLWPVGADSNSYQDSYSVLAPLRQMANQLGCMLILVTHRRKAETVDYIDSVIGSTGIAANADVILTLNRPRGEREAVLSIDGNDIESRKITIRFDTNPLGFQKSDADPAELSQGIERREILDAIRDLGRTAKPGQIAEKLGKKQPNVSQLCRKLVEEGILTSTKFGVYTLLNTTHSDDSSDSSKQTDNGTMRTISGMRSYLPRNDVNTGNEITQSLLGMEVQSSKM